MANKDLFFRQLNERYEAITFSDVLLCTGYSQVPPADVSLCTHFSRRINLKVPIVSAAMDTVTEHAMAIDMAKAGGIGVIHRNMEPEKQAWEVGRTKYCLNGLVDRPITVSSEDTLEHVLKRRERKNYTFHSFPVVNRQTNELIGLITETQFKFCEDVKTKVKEIMTTELVTAPTDTTLQMAYNIMMKNGKSVLPLVGPNNVLAGMYTLSDAKRILYGKSPTYNVDDKGSLRVAAAIGSLYNESTLERIELLAEENVDALVIDAAHADTKDVIDTIKDIKRRSKLDEIDLIVGNVSQPDSIERLVRAGVDAIKVGQGAGSICTTRIISGSGCPQLTAIYNCTQAALKISKEIPIIADGGIVYSGDITKALAAGASSVMLGSMLAGTRNAPGDEVSHQGRQYKYYRGMGSLGAMSASNESRARYNQIQTDSGKLVPEGMDALVPYKGELADVLFQMLGGLRSGMGSIGASTVPELQSKSEFIRLSHGGQREDHPHDVMLTQDAPNYRSGQTT